MIDPGEFWVTDQNVVISTLLGSCVSVCLQDPVHKISGMNHFLLSNRKFSKESAICLTEAGRYGVNAMELVLNRMYHLGAKKQYLKAKAFGGGNVLRTGNRDTGFFDVGSINVKFIKEFLQTERIPLLASALGGTVGRTIRFFTDDFSVYVKNINCLDTDNIRKRDQEYWEHSLKKREKKKQDNSNIDLW